MKPELASKIRGGNFSAMPAAKPHRTIVRAKSVVRISIRKKKPFTFELTPEDIAFDNAVCLAAARSLAKRHA